MPIPLSAARFLRLVFLAGCTILAGYLPGSQSAAARVSVSPAAPASVRINHHPVTIEIADTDSLRAEGLMHRPELPPEHGMLFVFPDSQPRCFWMKNTLIPLSIAFIDEQHRIVALDEMQPLSEETHCSGTAARYALEMNKDWFRSRGVRVGDIIEAVQPPALPVARDEGSATLQ